MSNIFKLDDLRAKAQEDFGDVVIPVSDDKTITLLNILRLSEAQREEIAEYFSQLRPEEDGPGMFDIITEILRRVASKREDGDLLIDLIGDDKPLLLVIFNKWSDRTQAGEA